MGSFYSTLISQFPAQSHLIPPSPICPNHLNPCNHSKLHNPSIYIQTHTHLDPNSTSLHSIYIPQRPHSIPSHVRTYRRDRKPVAYTPTRRLSISIGPRAGQPLIIDETTPANLIPLPGRSVRRSRATLIIGIILQSARTMAARNTNKEVLRDDVV